MFIDLSKQVYWNFNSGLSGSVNNWFNAKHIFFLISNNWFFLYLPCIRAYAGFSWNHAPFVHFLFFFFPGQRLSSNFKTPCYEHCSKTPSGYFFPYVKRIFLSCSGAFFSLTVYITLWQHSCCFSFGSLCYTLFFCNFSFLNGLIIGSNCS